MQLNEKLLMFDVQQCIINHCIKCYSDSIFEMAFNFINSNAWQITNLPVSNFLVTFICLSAD